MVYSSHLEGNVRILLFNILTYMSYFSGVILGFSGNFSGTNDIFLRQILKNSGTLSGTF